MSGEVVDKRYEEEVFIRPEYKCAHDRDGECRELECGLETGTLWSQGPVNGGCILHNRMREEYDAIIGGGRK